jgi:hypothetical protein
MSASPAFNVDRVKDGVDRVQATVLAETDKAIIYIENLDLIVSKDPSGTTR